MRLKPSLILLFIALAACARFMAAEPSSTGDWRVTGLRCEQAVDPLGIDVAQPRLSWRVESDVRGACQTRWRVLVASTAELLAHDQGDVWDSAEIASDQTSFVPYAGRPLGSSQQAFWKVRAWDQAGHASTWSEPATWTMGLLAPADWAGGWIAAAVPAETLLLRREFTVRPGLRRALVHVSGLGQYELTFNGAKAGNALLAPGWTGYRDTTLYDTLDVTAQLHPGANAAGLFLGNGMYNVVRPDSARFSKFTGSFGPLRAILNLRLEYADGTVDTIATDEHWRTRPGPVTFSSIYGGEDHDARLEPAGWNRPGFSDAEWVPAVRHSPPGVTLRGHAAGAEPVRAIEVRAPVGVKTFPDGTAVYDLGQNTAYMPRLRVSGPAGSTVRLIPAEITHPDGTINRNTMGAESRGIAWWQYTKATDGEETWMPRFFYSGGRYFKAVLTPATLGGAPPKLVQLEGVVVHSSAAPAGGFEASNELLNRIRTLVRWAQRSNMVSLLTDCPHREKLGWIEQLHLNGPALRYEFNLARLFAKSMHDMAGAQLASGLVPNIAPEYTEFKGTFRAAAEWGGSFFIVPWQQYEFTGDPSLLRDYYPAMQRYLAYLETKAPDGILAEGLGDWYDLGPKKPGAAQLTPPPVTATAYFYYDTKLLAQAAALLGRTDDARKYAARAEEIRTRYNREFYHADTGSYATGSQCANAMALVFGLPDEAERPRVFAALVRDVEARDCAVTAGDVGYRYLLAALAQGGRSDLIYRMVNQDTKPGYGFILKQGETAMTEAWDANAGSSHNHFMLGQVTEWFYHDLAGIASDPTAPGFKHTIVRPQPVGDLAWVAASYDSIHGPVAVRWKRQDGRFLLDVTVPANTTATVYVPAREGTPVLEGGRPAGHAPGVRFLQREGDREVYAIESGRYAFSAEW